MKTQELPAALELMASLFDAQPQAVALAAITDSGSRFPISYFNPAFQQLVEEKLRPEGQEIVDILSLFEQDRTILLQQLEEVASTGRAIELSILQEHPFRHLQFAISRVPSGILLLIQNRSDEYEALEVLQHKNQILSNIVRYSASGLSVTEVIRDNEGNIVDGQTIIANEAAATLTGISRADQLSNRISERDPSVLQSPLYHRALRTLKSGESFQTSYYSEISKRWLELFISKMDDDHLINVMTDITAAKEAQIKLEHTAFRLEGLIQELQQTNSNLEEFAYAASHDLKEPIRKIQYFTDRLQGKLKGKLGEEESNLFQKVLNATSRMACLVDDLLEYSHVSTGVPKKEDVTLNDVVDDVITDLEILIQEKGAVIQKANLPTIQGNRRQLQQLFQNLIANSLHYSKPNVVPMITVSCAKEVIELPRRTGPEQFYRITVTDNGIGFDPEDKERIFQVFQRAHDDTSYRGTGIGLAIAFKVASNHGGFIDAEGKPGVGSQFFVHLPSN